MTWNGEQVSFAAEEHLAINKEEKGTVLTWKVHRLDISPALQEQKDQVFQLIREALDARGRFCDRRGLASVLVQFNTLSN